MQKFLTEMWRVAPLALCASLAFALRQARLRSQAYGWRYLHPWLATGLATLEVPSSSVTPVAVLLVAGASVTGLIRGGPEVVATAVRLGILVGATAAVAVLLEGWGPGERTRFGSLAGALACSVATLVPVLTDASALVLLADMVVLAAEAAAVMLTFTAILEQFEVGWAATIPRPYLAGRLWRIGALVVPFVVAGATVIPGAFPVTVAVLLGGLFLSGMIVAYRNHLREVME